MNLKGVAMKIMATAKHDLVVGARKSSHYEWPTIPEASEHLVTKVIIGESRSTVTIKIDGYDEVDGINSIHFDYELVLDATNTMGERRVPVDIVEDFLRVSNGWPCHKTYYTDGMPYFGVDFIVLPG